MAAIARGNGHPIDFTEWHELQYWLADGQRRVEVPYAEVLATLIPPIAVRLRRDFGSLLGLIRAHALLHRATRPVDQDGRILATLEDYVRVRELVVDLISAGIGAQVSDATRETVKAVAELTAGDEEKRISNKMLAEHLKLDRSAVSRRVKVALDGGYLINDEDRARKPTRLRIGEPLPDDIVVLPEPDDVALCTDAVGSGPPHPPTDIDGNGGDRWAEARERLRRKLDTERVA